MSDIKEKKEEVKEEVQEVVTIEELEASLGDLDNIGRVSTLDKVILPLREALKVAIGEEFFERGGFIRAMDFEAAFYKQGNGLRIRIDLSDEPVSEAKVFPSDVEIADEVLRGLSVLAHYEARKRELLKKKRSRKSKGMVIKFGSKVK